MKTEKSKRLKGAVLFTVVSVMSLLIIFLMGTLLLASAANKRAQKSYAVSQAEYTAKTAIESFTKAMANSSAALRRSFSWFLEKTKHRIIPTIMTPYARRINISPMIMPP